MLTKIALVADYSDTANDTEGHAFIYSERMVIVMQQV